MRDHSLDEQHEATISLNPSFEALQFNNTVALFAGDHASTLRGEDAIALIATLKDVFASPQTEATLEAQHPEVHALLPKLLQIKVLQKHGYRLELEFYSSAEMARAFEFAASSRSFTGDADVSLRILIPNSRNISQYANALASLKPNQMLLAGLWRGSSLFVLPLLSVQTEDIFKEFHKLLATEPGIGNAYFLQDLENSAVEGQFIKIPDNVLNWVANDLAALVYGGKLNSTTAFIYRGHNIERETVKLPKQVISLSPQDDIRDTAKALEGTFVGLGRPIVSFEDFRLGAEERPYFCVRTAGARPLVLALDEKEDHNAWGSANTLEEARVSSFMEALERYSISSYSMSQFKFGMIDGLQKPMLNLSELSGLTTDQLADRFDKSVPRYWDTCRSLFTGKGYLVPVEFTRYPVPSLRTGYPSIDHGTSSGVAAHVDLARAIASGCHELIERDAFMIAWLRKSAPPCIDLSSLPAFLQEEVRQCTAMGWKVRIIDLTTDLAPVFSVMLSRDSEFAHHNIGAASHDDPATAIFKALREARINFDLFEQAPRAPEKVLEDIKSPEHHIELYGTGAYDDLLMRMFDAGPVRDFKSVASFTDDIVDRIHAVGLEVFITELTATDISKVAPDIVVVRCLIPGLVPIQFGKDWVRSSSSRIKEVPEKMGWDSVDFAEGLQTFPHPFP